MYTHARLQIFNAVKIQIKVIWVVMPHSVVVDIMMFLLTMQFQLQGEGSD
jgi:hypothetical protein